MSERKRFQIWRWRLGDIDYIFAFDTFEGAKRFIKAWTAEGYCFFAIVDTYLANDGTDRIVWRQDGAPSDWGTFCDTGYHQFVARGAECPACKFTGDPCLGGAS